MFKSVSTYGLSLMLIFNAIEFSYQFSCGDYNGTTPNLQQIVIGRCHYFLNTVHKGDCNFNPVNYNCSDIWNKFKKVVIGKDPCDIKIDEFSDYLSAVDHKIPNNSSLFWSGTYTEAHEITQFYKYWSLEDTFSGYLLNTLSFCSNNGSDSFNNDECPWMCGTVNNAYWNAASKYFAQKATGDVTVILNGIREIGAYDAIGTFANYELPYFNSSSVTSVKVVLLHKPGEIKYETCNDPKTLIQLKDIVSKKSIRYECEDDPKNIIALFCFTDPQSKECQSILSSLNNSYRNMTGFFTLIIMFLLQININFLLS